MLRCVPSVAIWRGLPPRTLSPAIGIGYEALHPIVFLTTLLSWLCPLFPQPL
jgi:hypothetical protein